MKNLFKLGAVATLSFGMAACSNDMPAPEGPAKAESDQTQYVCIALSSPAQGTRAFDDGTPQEHFVKSLDFLWYDANGVPTAQPTKVTDSDLNDKFVTEGTTTDNVTKIWKSTVAVSLVQGQNLPAQVICLVNADQADVNNLISKTLDELRDVKNRKFYSDGFQMSNSVYFGTNTLTGQPNQRLCATPVNKLYKTETEADAALKGNADGALLDIYVERKAAKITLNMTADAPKGYTLANGSGTGEITLTYHPEYWFMNATDKQNYVTKRYGIIPQGATDPVMKPTFTQINDALAGGAGWTTWNDPTNFRSYWGTSPSYFDNTYPMVSDEIDDLDRATTDPKPDDDLSLKYYTYNQVKTQGAAEGYQKQAQAATAAGAFSSTIYTFETTTAISEIKNTDKNPAATVASAVVVGHYTAGEATTASTFYVNRNLGKNGTYYATEADARNSMKDLQQFIFTDNQGTTVAPMSNFTLQHPKQAVRNKLTNPNIAGRLVALQLTDDAISKSEDGSVTLYFYNGTAYEKITTENAAQANAALIGAGYMDMFYNGLAFFSVPIRHLNWDDDYYTATDGYKWGDMKVGALGVVRNHSYSLTINKIEGLGTGLRDDDQPIVPPVTSLEQYVAVRLNILAWNVVNAWSVDL